MIDFTQPVTEHFASRFGLAVSDVVLSDLVSLSNDIPNIVEAHQELFDVINPSQIGEF